jgi:hypothetical protein
MRPRLPQARVRQDDVDRTAELLDTRRPRSTDDEATLGLVRALQPDVVVSPAERRNEKAMLLRAARRRVAQAAPVLTSTVADPAGDDPALHATTVPLGARREVTLVDLEPLDPERVAKTARLISELIVDALPAQRPDSDS